MGFAELSITSNFTFLTGGSHPEDYARRAALLGLEAIAIADENSVAGIVRAWSELKEIKRQIAERQAADKDPIGPPKPAHLPDPPRAPIFHLPRLLPATRLVLREGLTLTALPRDRRGWANLCRMLSAGRLRTQKGSCDLGLPDLWQFADGLELLLHGPPDALTHPRGAGDWVPQAKQITRRLGPACHLLMAPAYDGHDRLRFERLTRLAGQLGIPTVASAAPIMHHGARRRLTDVLTCIRLGIRVEDLGTKAQANAEQRLRGEGEIRRIFAGFEDAVDRTLGIAGRCTFDIGSLRYEYPSEISGGETASQRLERLARAGLKWRYPSGAPDRAVKMLEHELRLIAKLGYEPYFLTVHDIVAFARSRGILCQGRGSAANSITCYCLGVTSVSPEVGTMVFERFVSEARDEPPDIDVDFEHERREEVIQHIYERYGRHRAGLCATVIHYRGKRAVREVGRAMGLSEDILGALSSQIWGWGSSRDMADTRMRELGLDPTEPRLRQTMALVREIQGFPRHLSQHVGGFIVTEGRLDELVPIENATMEDRTVICWDKDDIDALGILKVDVLALGMLTCIRKAFDLIERHHQTDYSLATLPPEDPAVYDMLCKADSLGVFQVESRAQMNFLPRMRPRCFYDLVIQVAIIRPGPIQGDMVHPFIRRRNGEEQVSFPSDELGAVLGKTLGVPLFQEQAMQIAIIGAGFTPDQADRLRRSLATFKKHGNVSDFRTLFMRGMRERGYDEEFAARCFSQIEGFGSYGFPESHAASFALLVYASSWIKRHHPGIFACALLNSQPMGFYAPAQIVRDAREHGVEVRPVDVNESYWDNVMEPDGRGGLALRLGFRQIRSMREEDARWLAAARGNGYQAVEDVWRRAGLPARALAVLAEADAFAGIGLSRRDALWAAKALLPAEPLPLFTGDMDGEAIEEPEVTLPEMTEGEQVVEDYVSMRLTLRSHPVALIRHLLSPGLNLGATGKTHQPEREMR
ncbi:error-prone DNA polymerase [Nioella sediminis]|jgi:DNA-directed DNA polymerase III PolC|uniref:error-prone DNA polymerase n=1 Tax=Nioella sediminis TaxID=1912092 RepID=UPI0008FD1F13|nr:error-prone DNA polymerase [Nioella sediminis]TBX20504.1 DNA polymerase [Roseovarius sp. JS7-11]